MTTLDDKLMGEKTQNYCSSSEDEGEEEEEQSSSTSPPSSSSPMHSKLSNSKIDINSTSRWDGYSKNTGPKGVIRDWQLYKEHQAQLQEKEQLKLASELKKTTITCKSYGDQVKDQEKQLGIGAEEDGLEELLDDDMLQEFVKKRMLEQRQSTQVKAQYIGMLYELKSADEFLKIIEETDSRIPVIIHIYEESSKDCKRMNECLRGLASSYEYVQFCSATTGCVGVSRLFRSKGIPALLVYKGGELVGNFVQLREELGSDEFFQGDIENFLIEHGVLSNERTL